MVDSWRVATGGGDPNMENDPNTEQNENPTALAEVERILLEFQLEGVSLSDHAPKFYAYRFQMPNLRVPFSCGKP